MRVDPTLQGLPPVLGRATRVLILGSFPGEASLIARQYYAHPRNHFWPLLEASIDAPLTALPYRERLRQLRANRIGLWDVIVACNRRGSLDGAIRMAERGEVGRVRRAGGRARLLQRQDRCACAARLARRRICDARAAFVVARLHAAVRGKARGMAADRRVSAARALIGKQRCATRDRRRVLPLHLRRP